MKHLSKSISIGIIQALVILGYLSVLTVVVDNAPMIEPASPIFPLLFVCFSVLFCCMTTLAYPVYLIFGEKQVKDAIVVAAAMTVSLGLLLFTWFMWYVQSAPAVNGFGG